MTRAAKLDMSATIARAQRSEDTTVVAVSIAPLLAPYKKHGRLSLRVERLPQKARFSKGSRNNDGSWSLATDELEDLTYLLAKGIDREHTLAVRIISLVGGNTLAVLEYPIAPDAGEAPGETTPAFATDPADTQVQALRAQLAEMKAALSARESELADARNATAAPAVPERDIEAEVAMARAELQAEFDERLAAVGTQAATDLQKHRTALTAELNARVAAVKEHADRQLVEEHAALQREAQETIAKTLEAAKIEEAARLSAAQAQWRAETNKAVAQARAEAASAGDQNRVSEIESLRAAMRAEAQQALASAEAAWKKAEAERLAAAQVQWRAATRAALLADTGKTHAEFEAARTALQRDAQEALSAAEQNWKTAETARVAAAQAEWQRAADKALADVRTEMASTRDDGKENQALRDDMAALQVRLAERDAALAAARTAAEAAQSEGNAALAAAKDKLNSEEAARLATAQAQWRVEADKALAGAQAQWRTEADKALAAARAEHNAAVEFDNSDATPDDWREKIAALETALAERDATLAEAQDIIEQQSKASQQKSHKHSKADDKEHMAGLEAGWRASYENSLNEARSRYEAAEAALAHVRIRTKDDGRTNQELASTRAALAAREKELADLRAKFVPLDGQELEDGAAVTAPVEAPAAKPAPFSNAFIGAVIAAACVLAAAIVFYPNIEAMIYPAPPQAAQTAPLAKEAERLPPAAVDEHKATLLHDAKLRADPTTTAHVVASVTRGSEVVIVETQGKWARVRFQGTKSLEGWVAQAQLKDTPAP